MLAGFALQLLASLDSKSDTDIHKKNDEEGNDRQCDEVDHSQGGIQSRPVVKPEGSADIAVHDIGHGCHWGIEDCNEGHDGTHNDFCAFRCTPTASLEWEANSHEAVEGHTNEQETTSCCHEEDGIDPDDTSGARPLFWCDDSYKPVVEQREEGAIITHSQCSHVGAARNPPVLLLQDHKK